MGKQFSSTLRVQEKFFFGARFRVREKLFFVVIVGGGSVRVFLRGELGCRNHLFLQTSKYMRDFSFQAGGGQS